MAKEQPFGVISKFGSPIFEGTADEKLDELLMFLAGIEDWSIGTVPAGAPRKKTDE